MLLLESPVRAPARHRLSVSLAESRWEVLEAQRLRFKVFAEEMGARLPNAQFGLDRDMYDPYCEHLLVREDRTGEVVGTCRILTSHQARRIGGFYAEEEFDLTRFQHQRERLLEVGRACVHPDHRSGATIALLKGRANYVCLYRLRRAGGEARLASQRETAQLRTIAQFAIASRTGDRADLATVPEDSAVWQHASSTCPVRSCRRGSSTCIRMRTSPSSVRRRPSPRPPKESRRSSPGTAASRRSRSCRRTGRRC